MKRADRVILTNLHEIVSESGFDKQTATHYIAICPYCMETEQKTHKKLYIKKDYSVGFCFSCNSAFLPQKGQNKDELLKEYPVCLEMSLQKQHAKSFIDVQKIDTSAYDLAQDYSDEGIEYLSQRPDANIAMDYDNYGIRFTPNGVILPIYTFGHLSDVVFFQIRYFNTVEHGNKYFMPIISEKPIAVVHKGVSDTAWCVEGIFGAIAITRQYPQDTVLAFLGKFLTDFHAWQLGSQQDWIKKYIVFLDETDLSKKFCQGLLDAKLFIEDLQYVESQGTDPDELLQLGGIPIIKQYKQEKSWKAPDFKKNALW